jgi:hypothetical protein
MKVPSPLKRKKGERKKAGNLVPAEKRKGGMGI